MIQCIIDGHTAYPLSTSSIKVTYANQYVTDDGEYTYDITFPMDILANREVFKNVSRFEVAKNIAKYDDCKLYCSGLLIMSGVGTILSVNQSEVKLQIVGGKSRIKFNDKMAKHYIDEIDFGEADAPGIQITSKFTEVFNIRDLYSISSDASEFLGVQGKWCFMPVRDETNDMIANFVSVDTTGNITGTKNRSVILNIAVQPSLMYIFRKVVEHEGYRLTRNDFDCNPWNLIYIASAFKTRELRRALPHWSSYTFIEEFRKFFGATIYFDDFSKTCQVIKSSEIASSDSTCIEPFEEYSTDYDEDGSFSTSSTANLEFNLGDSAGRGDYEVIPQKIFDNFEIVDSFDTMGVDRQFAETTQGWTEKQKFTTIIRHYGSYYIYIEDTDGKRQWQLAGIWSPLVRDKSSDDYMSLNISPAAQVTEDINFYMNFPFFGKKEVESRCLLSIPNDKESDVKDAKSDDDGYSYVTVQDAIDDDSALDESEDDEECINVFFIMPGLAQRYKHPLSSEISVYGENSRWPVFVTDYRINADYMRQPPKAFTGLPDGPIFCSLALNPAFFSGESIGQLHASGLKVDNHNCIEVKFRADNIPDPSKIYIIRGKKYVCEKIEVEVKDDGIEPIKTGYFYMMS